ncbi:antitoxin Xre/MbcA/ParS toxin-binding domain-containing protein [Pseudomonas coleopterorum]|uniref:antitoxin Xre/MbcA/ParS toxin-binding domain-containing protein n=1 Tax=Pseudomonas coleopterorum TaxID=1605838 RepID=UPI0008977706|nr:Protein of unknown function [Pseudomonas coleopterorum]
MYKPEGFTRSRICSLNCWSMQYGFFLARREQILIIAERVLGSRSSAELWFVEPVRGLNYQCPCKLLSTSIGFFNVEAVLWQIEQGVYI